MQSGEDELRDLSVADAGELRAFLDKRRWFEAKLKILEGAVPIYPFLHPNIKEHSSKPNRKTPEYAVLDGSQSALPTAEQVKIWQSERDALEEEIYAFDGGDLDKMKQKTRQVTLIPLTPPSTHLVSITLDLIVVVDRLLTLLRRRMELLELTSLRLKWDQLRWEIMAETSEVRAEIKAIVEGKGRWKPPTIRAPDDPSTPGKKRFSVGPASGSRNRVQTTPIPTSVSKLGSSTSLSSELSTVTSEMSPSGSPEDRRRTSSSSLALSAMRDMSTPSRNSLQLPILHSQISNVEIRHNNLKSTLLARSGKILDKMVDVAGPLRGLGGTLGRIEEEADGGAVPDELLDLQDTLEEDVQGAGAGIAWCRGLEEEWKSADAHFASSSRSKALAQGLLFDLLAVLQDPASTVPPSDWHARFVDVESKLPGDPRSLMPPISDSSTFDTEDRYRSAEVLSVLVEARAEAEKLIEECREAIDFHAKYVESQARLSATQTSLLEVQNAVVSAMSEIAPLQSSHYHLALEGSVDDSTCIARLVDRSPAVLKAVDQIRQLCPSASKTAQEGTILAMRHRAFVKQVPKCLRDEGVVFSTDWVEEVDELSAAILDQATTAARQGDDALSNAETLQMAHGLYLNLDRVEPTMRDLTRRVELAVDQLPDEAGLKSLETDYRTLRETFTEDMKRPHERLEQRIATVRKLDPFRDHLGGRVASLDRIMDRAAQLLRLVTTTMSQADIVARIEKEATDLLVRIGIALDQAEQKRQEPVTVALDLEVTPNLATDLLDLTTNIQAWDSSLAHRMVWLSTLGHVPRSAEVVSSPSTIRDATWSASRPPMTPPASPPLGSASGRSSNNESRSEERDLDARRRVNEASGRVQSALMELKELHENLPFDVWQKRMTDLLAEYSGLEETCDEREDQLARDLARLSDSKASSTDPTGLRNTLDRCEALQGEAGPSATRLAGLVASYANVASWISARPEQASNGREGGDQTDLEHRFIRIRDQAAAFDDSIVSTLEDLLSRLLKVNEPPTDILTNTDDVFGPMTTVESNTSVRSAKSGQESFTLPSLIKRLDDLRLELLLRPTKPQIRSSPQWRDLPRAPTAQRIKSELQAISAVLDAIDADNDSDDSAHLRVRLDEAFKDLPLLDQLVRVASAANECDNRFSDLIEAIDEVPLAHHRIDGARDKANSVVVRLKVTARPVENDFRVTSTVKRVGTTWTELEALAEATLHPSRATSEIPDDISETTSAAPSRMSVDRSFTGSIPARSRQSSRTTSNPMFSGAGYLSPTKSSQARSASDTITSSGSASRIPRARHDSVRSNSSSARLSLSLIGPSFSSFDLTSSRIPTPNSVRTAATPRRPSGITVDETPRPRRSTRLSSSTSVPPRRAYVADPKSKLDVAVGKVVNKLNVDVPVRPVGQGAGHQWKDQSGKYWIGAEGRAKLCFCRILRSKTVMVRVGGGWVELSQFLLEHFSSSFGSWQAPTVDLNSPGIGIGSSKPIHITSASLQTPAKSHQTSLSAPMTGSTRPSVARKVTPARQALVADQIDEMLTPVRGETSPGAGVSRSGGSPLYPLQFMRKASESPPVREKEKERYKAGSRSILGKGTIR